MCDYRAYLLRAHGRIAPRSKMLTYSIRSGKVNLPKFKPSRIKSDVKDNGNYEVSIIENLIYEYYM